MRTILASKNVEDLRSDLEAYISTRLKGLDQKLVRIKIVLPDAER
jgi:hypothetical protein